VGADDREGAFNRVEEVNTTKLAGKKQGKFASWSKVRYDVFLKFRQRRQAARSLFNYPVPI